MSLPPPRCVICAVALLAGAAVADETPPQELERIEVTATRTPQSVQAVPAAVSVVAGDALHGDAPGVTLSEKLAGVPGVLARDRHNPAQDEQISIRGFGTRASFGIRGVRLLIDGIPATMPDGQGQVSHFPLAFAERIEVLRGPFSALYGNAAGGVIQLFTADGAAPGEFTASLGAGAYSSRRISADVRDGGDDFNYNLGVNRFDSDGFREHSRARRTLFNAKTSVDLGATRLTLLANALDAPDAQDPLGLTRAQFAADPAQASPVARQFDTRKSAAQRQLGAVLTHAAGAGAQWRVLAYAGAREVTQFLAIPVTTQANPLHGGGVVDLHAPYAGIDARWTQATTLAGAPLEFTLGVNADRQRQQRRGYENFVGTQLGVRGALRLDQRDRVAALDEYAQATWRPRDQWSLMAGVRHSEIAFRSRDRYVTAANPDDSGHVTYRATSPVLGIGWQPQRAWQWFAAFGHGFETPTFNELGYRADGGSGLNFALRPARTHSGEAGFKFAGDDGLRGEVVLFRADTRDELAVDTSSGGRTTFQNAGRARRTGAEASASVPLARAWRAQLAWTHVDARYRDGFLACASTPCAHADTRVAPRTRIPGVPRDTLSAALRRGGDEGWHAQLESRFIASVPVNNLGDEHAAACTTFGASLGYGFRNAHGSGRAFVALDNLFDSRYAGSVIVNEANRRYYEPAPGRNVWVGLEWRWDETRAPHL